MKILWFVNIEIPSDGNGELSGDAVGSGSWLVYLYNRLRREPSVRLTVVFPQHREKALRKKQAGETLLYGFYSERKPLTVYDKANEAVFRDILTQEKPDIVHLWGTEYSHCLALVNAFARPERTVISVQGLISICARHYQGDLPEKAARRWTFRDLVRLDNLKCQQKNFEKRGCFEKEALKKTGYVIGRTDWDEAACMMLAPEAVYFRCNESLRDVFYEKKACWSPESCRRHRLFAGQAGYPLKGLHKVIEAMGLLISDYPDMELRIAGDPMDFSDDMKSLLLRKSYTAYIKKLIEKQGLREHIHFTGMLSPEGMAEELLAAHVFISASSMENESNSLSEAKMLGLPVIASAAGGTASRIQHGIDGFQYQYEESYLLAYYIRRIFEDDGLARSLGEKASEHAAAVNDREKNYCNLLSVYDEILKGS
ncbi:MAG: glycosyltransferase family 4 protein [Lachnospiraceae bacterium]|nr:glycosyltransferase family 4 protein [Lachnospiraceae bacterium]